MSRVILLLLASASVALPAIADTPPKFSLWRNTDKPKQQKQIAATAKPRTTALNPAELPQPFNIRLLRDREEEPEPNPTPVPPSPTPPLLPSLELPEVVTGKTGTFIKITAVTNGTHVRWKAISDNLAVFPGEMLVDSRSTVVTSSAAGDYELLAYTALNDIPSDPATTIVRITGPPAPVPPPGPQPGPLPPPPVPPVTAAHLFIVTVDDVLARTPAMTTVFSDFAMWDSFKAAGHQYKMLNSTDPEAAKFAEQIALNGGLPVVVIMAWDAANPATAKWMNKNPDDLKFPATSADMRALIAKYSGAK